VQTLVVAVRATGLLFYFTAPPDAENKGPIMFQVRSPRRRNSCSPRGHAKQDFRARRVSLEALESRLALTGTWTPLAHAAPAGIGTMELLSDGTVMAQASTGNASSTWYKLTPDVTGSYVNGNWSQLTSMSFDRLYFDANVLQDGRVFVLGGVTATGKPIGSGEIYDPLTNSWYSTQSYPEATFSKGSTMLLSDGRVLAEWQNGPETHIYDPATNTWSDGPTKLDLDKGYREPWTKLPDGSILSYNLWNNPGHSQRYDPATNSWIDSEFPPVPLSSASDPLVGAGYLLPDGRVFKTGGSTANTALYTPATTPGGTGTWDAGPPLPGAVLEAPGAVMPNGHVLLAYGTSGLTSTQFCEFDPLANSITPVASPSPDVSGWGSYGTRMLVLPSGQVLFAYEHNQLYVYTPDGSPQAAWKPTISPNGIIQNGDHYTLTGTQLNGLSAGAGYSPASEMDSNYPIVELKDGSGKVYFARTSNWSNTGVATGTTPVSTDFTLPSGLPYGTYSLSVVANGIASDPVSFTGGTVGTSADLAVLNSGPSASIEGDSVTYTLAVTNNGPSSATGVVLTDTLGANLKYLSATKSQGTFTQTGSVVKFTFGSIAVGQTATATVSAQFLEDGNLTNSDSVTSSVFDADTTNNSRVLTTAVAESPIIVSAPTTVNGKKVNSQTVATFTHASGIEPGSAFVAAINWGDGTTSAGTITLSKTTYSVTGSHTYSGGGSHTVTTMVVEASSGSGPMTAMAILGGNTVDNSGAATGESLNSGITAQSPSTGSSDNRPRIKSNLVDQLLAADFDTRGSRILARRTALASEDILDNLFTAE
jgi:uncharacterized repeat protein (TIGR01451 family)